jgi:hypothetical protein
MSCVSQDLLLYLSLVIEIIKTASIGTVEMATYVERDEIAADEIAIRELVSALSWERLHDVDGKEHYDGSWQRNGEDENCPGQQAQRAPRSARRLAP